DGIADVVKRRAVLAGRQRAVGGTGRSEKTHPIFFPRGARRALKWNAGERRRPPPDIGNLGNAIRERSLRKRRRAWFHVPRNPGLPRLRGGLPLLTAPASKAASLMRAVLHPPLEENCMNRNISI